MNGSYSTLQGDTWDMIAHKKLGSTDQTDRLMAANLERVGNLIFQAGVQLNLPEVEGKKSKTLPPWKR